MSWKLPWGRAVQALVLPTIFVAACSDPVIPDDSDSDTENPVSHTGGSKGSGGSKGTGGKAKGSGGQTGTACCLPGETCAPTQPRCEVTCGDSGVRCAAGEQCLQGSDGEVIGCTDECLGVRSCGATCCAPGATCGEDEKCVAADLKIESAKVADQGFSTVDVPEGSCGIQDGCYGDSGKRTLIPFELTVTNIGDAPLDIGGPWESPEFYLSACASEYLTPNFVKAEVLSEEGEVLATQHLPASCIAADDSKTYRCSLQGLAHDELSEQPNAPCKGLDATGLAPGAYGLRLTVNADQRFAESDFGNNIFELTLEKPECDGQFCGGVCCPGEAACIQDTCMLPDLRANQDAVERSLVIQKKVFGQNSCELAEMCVSGPGKRRLLSFEGRIENVGAAALSPGPEEGNPLFEFSSCHRHHHFLDFTDYKLLTPEGAVAAQGHKQSFCLLSMERVEDYEAPISGEVVHPEPGDTGCSYLEAGWADIYSVGTPCQWVDVTDVAPGDYVLQVAVNPAGRIDESNIDNNVIQVPVNIPPDSNCQDEEICGDVVDQDCDGLSDFADSDCRESALCCGAEDVCGLEDNWSCDCNGEPEWEQHDCSGSGYGGYSGYEPYYSEVCCQEGDPCNWGHDGVCDCQGNQEWDALDCQYNGGGCCNPWDPCEYANDGVCDCGGQMPWDYNDCSEYGYGGSSSGGSSSGEDCCDPSDPCGWSGDTICDCDGAMPWDTDDCAGYYGGVGGTLVGPQPTCGGPVH